MKQKLMTALLVFAMLLTLLPTAAMAADSDFVIKDHVLTKYAGSAEFVEIPDTVTSIGQRAFQGCTTIKSVTIPGSVRSVGGSAFRNCTALETVLMEEGVEEIGASAFEGCNSLANVILADSITSIGGNAFLNCTGLVAIMLPTELEALGDRAFKNCTSLSGVWIYDGLSSISKDTFDGCGASLSIVCAPGSAAEALAIAQSIPYDSILPSIGVDMGDFYVRKQVAWGYTGGSDVVFPEGIISLDGDLFRNNTTITSVTFSDGFEEIPSKSFSGCINLKAVTIPDSVTQIGSSAFSGCPALTSVSLSRGLQKINSDTFRYCRGLVSVDIPDSVTTIAGEAFQGCSSLKTVTIPDSVTDILSKAFADCSSLTSVYIMNKKTLLYGNVFQNCDSLTIYGYAGSYAEQYAQYYDIPFQAIDGDTQIPSGGTTDSGASPISFSDVSPTDYFYEGVQWAVGRNITNGVGGGRFAPNEDCTVAQILTFIWRFRGSPVAEASTPYSNLTSGDYYYNAIRWAYENGIYVGETFDPDQPCTRSMTVEFFWRMSGSPAADTNSGMTDVPSDASYASAVTWALANHVTTGIGDNKFSPDTTCTRGQIVTFLSRIG